MNASTMLKDLMITACGPLTGKAQEFADKLPEMEVAILLTPYKNWPVFLHHDKKLNNWVMTVVWEDRWMECKIPAGIQHSDDPVPDARRWWDENGRPMLMACEEARFPRKERPEWIAEMKALKEAKDGADGE